MKSLFESINVTTNKNIAPDHARNISHEEWSLSEETAIIVGELHSLDNIDHDYTDVNEGIDVIENALNSSYPDERVYFWLDA